MAKDIYLDPLINDIALINKSMRLTETIPESSRQQVYIDLSTFTGEWYVNNLAGVPYLANDTNPIKLLGTSSKATYDNTIKGNILARENVKSILEYESVLDKNTRTITITQLLIESKTGEEVEIQNIPIGL